VGGGPQPTQLGPQNEVVHVGTHDT
jgi:hypothetical protein